YHRDVRVLQHAVCLRSGRSRPSEARLNRKAVRDPGLAPMGSRVREADRRPPAVEMSMSYDVEWRARFDEHASPTPDLPDISGLRQTLLRRTHRRYDDRGVSEDLLRLLLGAAFSASSKSDLQQASVVRVADLGRRDQLAALVPEMPWIGNAPVFL